MAQMNRRLTGVDTGVPAHRPGARVRVVQPGARGGHAGWRRDAVRHPDGARPDHGAAGGIDRPPIRQPGLQIVVESSCWYPVPQNPRREPCPRWTGERCVRPGRPAARRTRRCEADGAPRDAFERAVRHQAERLQAQLPSGDGLDRAPRHRRGPPRSDLRSSASAAASPPPGCGARRTELAVDDQGRPRVRRPGRSVSGCKPPAVTRLSSALRCVDPVGHPIETRHVVLHHHVEGRRLRPRRAPVLTNGFTIGQNLTVVGRWSDALVVNTMPGQPQHRHRHELAASCCSAPSAVRC